MENNQTPVTPPVANLEPAISSPSQTPVPPPSRRFSPRNILFVVGSLLGILLTVGGGTYLFLSQKSNQPPITVKKESADTLSPTKGVKKVIPKENTDALSGDLHMTYLLTPVDQDTVVFKYLDFSSKTSGEFTLPHPKTLSSSEAIRYVFSPDRQFVAKISQKKLEVAPLRAPLTYTLIHEAPVVLGGADNSRDFGRIGDVYWTQNNTLYFLSHVGIDGLGAPKGGSYSDLYSASVDGSSKKQLSDHTKQKQNYGILREIYAVDTAKNELYLSKQMHGGHRDTMDVVDLASGEVVKSLKGISYDAGEPVFSANFSKAYYVKSLRNSDEALPTHLYEYDMQSGESTLLYSIPGFTTTDSTPYFATEASPLTVNSDTNTLYIMESTKGIQTLQAFSLSTKEKKLIYTHPLNSTCAPPRLWSKNARYLMLLCSNTDSTKFMIHDTQTKTDHLFYTQPKVTLTNPDVLTLDIIDFK